MWSCFLGKSIGGNACKEVISFREVAEEETDDMHLKDVKMKMRCGGRELIFSSNVAFVFKLK